MVEKTVQSAGSVPEAHPLRGWRSVFFAPVGDGQRRRRGATERAWSSPFSRS